MLTTKIPVRITRKQASEYILATHGVHVKPTTLAKLASIGGGPVFESFGNRPYYMPADLDQWVAARLTRRASTSARSN